MSAPTRGEAINTWVQTVAIIFAGLWALYIFVYKEVVVPRSAEGSLDVSLDLSVAGSSATYTSIAMAITVKNSSPRRVYLLPSAFFVWGNRYALQESSDEDFCKRTQKAFLKSSDAVLSRYAKTDDQSMVASGRVLSNYYFDPSESSVQTIIFYVPKDTFDAVDAYVLLPQAHSTENLKAEWRVDAKSRAMDLYERKNAESEWIMVDKNDSALRARTGYGTSTAHKMLCLWPSAEANPSHQSLPGSGDEGSGSSGP